MLLTECIDNFGLAMAAHGLDIADNTAIVADGELHRFTAKGDKANSKNGWFVLFDGEIPAGSFGSWKLGITANWCSKSKQEFGKRERRQHQAQMEQARNKRALEQRRDQHQAAIKCGELWRSSTPLVSAGHPYITAKKIRAYGLRQLNQMLLVPIQDALGRLVNLQFITTDGAKRFKSGGMVKDCYMVIGELTESAFICEGYATGATIHEATGAGVVVAFNTGNLSPVIKSLRSSHPDLRLTIAADNDRRTTGNPGLTKGSEAARSFNLPMVYPVFTDDQRGSDFNDLAALVGLEDVAKQLKLNQSEAA